MTPFLSIILPAHNEEQRLPQTLLEIDQFISEQSWKVEVVIVENGSLDRTLEIAREYASSHTNVVVIHEDRPGKGLAVKQGMLAASGNYRFFCDVDLSMPIDQIPRFLPPVLTSVDIAIGSREAKGSIRYNEPFYRHFIGRLFSYVVWFLVLPGINDTQCGFKCFTAAATQKLFPLQTVHDWAFDVEILAIAKKMGYKIVEVPIPWYYSPQSKVNVLRDLLQTTRDVLKVRKIIRSKAFEEKH